MNKNLTRLAAGLGVGVAGLVGTIPMAGAQLSEDGKGPDCAEIVGGAGVYSYGATPVARVVTSRLTLLAPACRDITYTFEVTYTTLTGTAGRVVTTSYAVAGPDIEFRVDVPELDAPSQVNATVTTAKRGKALDDTSTLIAFDVLPGSGGGSYQG